MTQPGMIVIRDGNEVLQKIMVVKDGRFIEDLAIKIAEGRLLHPEEILQYGKRYFGKDSKLTILYRTEIEEGDFEVITAYYNAELSDFNETDFEKFNEISHCPLVASTIYTKYFLEILVDNDIFYLRDRNGKVIMDSEPEEEEKEEEISETEALLLKIEKLEGDLMLVQKENQALRRSNSKLKRQLEGG